MPRATEKVVNEAGDIANVHKPIPIAIGIKKIDCRGIVVEQIVNQGSHITDVHKTIVINITNAH